MITKKNESRIKIAVLEESTWSEPNSFSTRNKWRNKTYHQYSKKTVLNVDQY
jgi:hypothetical protein